MRRWPEAKAARAAPDEKYRRIYSVVAAIPRGCVASYGQVAASAGFPRGARLVGRALAQCRGELPWHRVLGATGRISLPAGSEAFTEQVRRLAAEGVTVHAGRVSSRHFHRPQDTVDALLWGPRAARTVRRKGK
jgi:methylated-DNA-protein-cysteine methyltransferase-like protein